MKIRILHSGLRFFIAIGILASVTFIAHTPTTQAATDPWWNPDITAQAAADLYCDAGNTGGSSALIPREGITLSNAQWSPVTLRSVGCGGANERQLTFFGLEHDDGTAPIDFSQSGLEDVTNKSDVTDADSVQLEGDEIWMYDSGIGNSSGHQGNDITLRINRSLYPTSGEYEITTHGMGWFVDNDCPTPLDYDDIEDGGDCDLTGGEKTNQEPSVFTINIDALPPIGNVRAFDTTSADGSTVGKACTAITGWAFDEDSPSTALPISVYINTAPEGEDPVLELIYTTTANRSRDDDYDDHGFSIPTTILNQQVSIEDPEATLYFQTTGVEQNGDLVGLPIDIGDVDISVCLPTAPDTGNNATTARPALITGSILLTLLGVIIIRRRLHAVRQSK